jgi:DNA-directed RNA polymerase subunit RPC12/RpoP
MTMTISNFHDLANWLGAEGEDDAALRESISRAVYKGTDCGAWIEFDDEGVLLGSIVEGADFGTVTYRLEYPFTADDWNAREEAIEKEAEALWVWSNEIIYVCHECNWSGKDFDLNDDTEIGENATGDFTVKCPNCGVMATGKTEAEWGTDAPDVSLEFEHLGQSERSS